MKDVANEKLHWWYVINSQNQVVGKYGFEVYAKEYCDYYNYCGLSYRRGEERHS